MKFPSRNLDLSRPRVMGILNVTPDSFSDGGRYVDLNAAVDAAASMLQSGADIIDIGAESTRPGADAVPESEELDRLLPVLEKVVAELDVIVSVDTRKPGVMRAVASAGAEMINDVCALRTPGAIDAAADLDLPICLMHMLGTPETMQVAPSYRALPDDIITFFSERLDACDRAGLDRQRLLIDPGFGFGKTDAHNLEILAKLDQLAALGLPLLVGLSRKKTLGNLTGQPVDKRTAAGVAAAVLAVERGATIVRTHDVRETVDALRVIEAAALSRFDGAQRQDI